MFFYISKAIVFLTDPLFVFFLFCFFFLFRLKRRLFPMLVFLIFYFLSTSFVSQRLMFALENLKQPTIQEKQYDAVVVLSGMLRLTLSSSEKIEFNDAVDRILAGIDIVQSNKAKYLVLSGGDGSMFQTGRSESNLLADFSKTLGVSQGKILVDHNSKNTFENAVNTKKIITDRQFKDVLLITSAFHMFRSQGCFNRQGMLVDVFPVDYRATLKVSDYRDFLPSAGALSQSRRFIHETIGIIAYGLTGKARYTF